MKPRNYSIFLIFPGSDNYANIFVVIEDLSCILEVKISVQQHCCASSIVLVLFVDLYAFHLVFFRYIGILKQIEHFLLFIDAYF